MNQEAVIFKGSKNGIIIVMNQQVSFTDICKSIKEKFASSGAFFSGTNLNMVFRGRILSDEEEEELTDMISCLIESDVKISFDATPYAPEEVPLVVNEHETAKAGTFDGINEGFTKFYRGTVRSGQLINSVGNLVIVGDVNPGAEIIAAGNIVVMGLLRGIVHAGCQGNRDAFVAAFNLQPTQLRIADIITRSPDDEGQTGEIIPEIAYIKGNVIYIDRYLPKKGL